MSVFGRSNFNKISFVLILFLSKLDPNKFLRIEFKNFGQQQDLTKKAFVFCMTKNAEELDAEAKEQKQVGQGAKKKRKKKGRRPIVGAGGEDNDPEYVFLFCFEIFGH